MYLHPILYLTVSLALLFYVGQRLRKDAEVMLLGNLGEKRGLAAILTRNMIFGFYLVCIGFIILVSIMETEFHDSAVNIENIGDLLRNIGCVVLAIGALHVFTMRTLVKLYVIHRETVTHQEIVHGNA